MFSVHQRDARIVGTMAPGEASSTGPASAPLYGVGAKGDNGPWSSTGPILKLLPKSKNTDVPIEDRRA